jgi:acetoin utilization protein AcuB
MFVRDHMTRNVTALQDDAKLLDAALLIRQSGKRHVPIVSAENGKVVGIISDRDVLRLSPSVLSKQSEEEYNQLFESTPITAAMTKAPVSISPDAPILDAVELLYDKKISALLVMQEGKLEGIITTTDVLALVIEMIGGSKMSAMSGDD